MWDGSIAGSLERHGGLGAVGGVRGLGRVGRGSTSPAPLAVQAKTVVDLG